MRAPRSESAFIAQLDEELAWRVFEITAIQRSIKQAKGPSQTALVRAAVPLLYAHWEGCIKALSSSYADFISRQGRKYSDLKQCFSGIKAHAHVRDLGSISKRVFATSEILLKIQEIPNQKANIPLASYISNIGNLNYDMFEQISSFVGIDTSFYATKKTLIDTSLLKQRNEIAHGEFILVNADAFDSMSRDVIIIMRQFKDDVQNALVVKSYLRDNG